jgi:hypothetical protein
VAILVPPAPAMPHPPRVGTMAMSPPREQSTRRILAWCLATLTSLVAAAEQAHATITVNGDYRAAVAVTAAEGVAAGLRGTPRTGPDTGRGPTPTP